jgi:hypothetical protein
LKRQLVGRRTEALLIGAAFCLDHLRLGLGQLHDVQHFTKGLGDAGRHRGRNAKGLMDADEVVKEHEEGDRIGVVFELLREGVGRHLGELGPSRDRRISPYEQPGSLGPCSFGNMPRVVEIAGRLGCLVVICPLTNAAACDQPFHHLVRVGLSFTFCHERFSRAVSQLAAFINAPAVAAHMFLNVHLDLGRKWVVWGHAANMGLARIRG